MDLETAFFWLTFDLNVFFKGFEHIFHEKNVSDRIY